MELECRMGNIRVLCTLNQALAMLLQAGLPKIDNRKSSTGTLVFITHVPLSVHGYAHRLGRLRDELTDMRKTELLNGAVLEKWMELMEIPADCVESCHKLKPDTLNIMALD